MQTSMHNALHTGGNGWWYRGRRSAVRALLTRANYTPHGVGLDYGAGFGAMRPVFEGCSAVDALEVYPEALTVLRGLPYRNVFSRDMNVLANEETYDTIGVFDVLEHIEDDVSFLAHARGVLRHDGVLVGTVPAHPMLFGAHDEENHHYRRYTKKELTHKLARAGFTVRAMSYWNMSLAPCAIGLRLAHVGHTDTQLKPLGFIDTLLGWVLSLEAVLLRYIPLPMGLSIVFVAERKN